MGQMQTAREPPMVFGGSHVSCYSGVGWLLTHHSGTDVGFSGSKVLGLTVPPLERLFPSVVMCSSSH